VLFPDPTTPTDSARKAEKKCDEFSDARIAPLISPNVIESVDPLYAYVVGGPNGREAHLRGSRISFRPTSGVTAEILERSLQCHQARALLAQTPSAVDDPYVLADRWLTIDVTSSGSSLVANVQADQFDDARLVLERAKRFSGAR
jgi:hypothetical protein